MNKEYLEALKNIKIRCHSKVVWDDPIDFALDIIEQALVKLDFLEDAMDLPTNCFSIFKNRNGDEITVMRRERYEKYCEEEKVLKIVFEKKVDIELLNFCEDRYEYNMHFSFVEMYHLTQEEFDLLKKYCDKEDKRE